MRYWAYLNNEVLGPFEKEKLKELANFGPSSLICPEGGQAEGWKEASTFPEVRDMLSPAPARPQTPAPMTPQRRSEEPPLAMTMRGTLIEKPPAASPVSAAAQQKPAVTAAPSPAAAPAATPPRRQEEPPPSSQAPSNSPALSRAIEQAALEKPKESSTRGLPGRTPAASDNASSNRELDSQVAQLRQKMEQMSALLTSMGDSQFQLLNRLTRLESAITEIKALLLPPPPK